MMKRKVSKRLLYISAATAALAISGTAGSLYAHTGGDVTLLDASGNPVAGTTNPYSPKMSCSSLQCHHAASYPEFTGHDYESAWATSVKSQVNRSGDVHHYELPYPQHGASAGYHFQQGRNIDWVNTDDDPAGSLQAQFYGVAKFTSSSGMYGKY